MNVVNLNPLFNMSV